MCKKCGTADMVPYMGSPEDRFLYTPLWTCTACNSVISSTTARNAGWIAPHMAHKGYSNIQEADAHIVYQPFRDLLMVQKTDKSVV